MDLVIQVGALGIVAAICFRIAWEEYKWPTAPKRRATRTSVKDDA